MNLRAKAETSLNMASKSIFAEELGTSRYMV